jgi:LPS-assembly lipoprotein
MKEQALALRVLRPHIEAMLGADFVRALARGPLYLHAIAPLFAPKNPLPLVNFSKESARKTDSRSPQRGGGGDAARSLRIAAVAACGLWLSGCGFHPLYGNTALDTHVGPTLANVYVEPISDRVGYELRNNLLDLFNGTGQNDGATYRLKLSLSEMEEAVVLQSDTAITRYNYTLSAHYELIPRESTAAVKSGNVTARSAYNVAAAPFLYATVTAERDAKNRAANDMAERIRTQIAVYLRNTATPPR